MPSQTTIANLSSGRFKTKMRAGGYYTEVYITVEKGRMLFNFGYNKPLIEEIKVRFEKRRYHGFIEGDGRKLWSAPITLRNIFQLEALQGKYCEVDPYANWDIDGSLEEHIRAHCVQRSVDTNPYAHQIEQISAALNVHHFLIGGEMGTGKTLSAIIAMEMCGFYEQGYRKNIWVGPNSALVAAKADFRKWRTHCSPDFMTYNGLVKAVEEWEGPAPRILILDEASRCKTHSAQRSEAAQHMADSMRKEWGFESLILLLTGTPAPKSPADWWKQLEIVCPGFLREGSWYSFRERMGFFTEEQGAAGNSFKKLVSWKDSPEKCGVCSEKVGHPNHFQCQFDDGSATWEKHNFEPAVDEVSKLAERMKGAVGVWLKSECLDLPEKRYQLIKLEPSMEMMNAARTIVQTTTRGADALIKLRTLSDGFLYREQGTGEYRRCPGCSGRQTVTEYYEEGNPYDVLLPEEVQGNFRYIYDQCPPDVDPNEFIPTIIGQRDVKFEQRQVDCQICDGKGEIEQLERIVDEVDCPKIELLDSLLQQHEEIGRLNIYAGFTGSIQRLVRECLQRGWDVLKADGQGWSWFNAAGGEDQINSEDMVYRYQNCQDEYRKVAFVGQPGAAGMGLTLTAAPTTFFYSNDFIPENRMQAEDRGHRIGMDEARGGVIVDCIHLPSDERVINALRQSKQLQRIPMKLLQGYYEDATV